jgi:primosomal protein N' (replication factor Y)
MRAARESGKFQAILLHGVTGSGKTEVYIRALREVLEDGGRGLVLVPEISLTPQTVRRFREGLRGAPIAVLHSMLSALERTGQWRDIQEGRARVVIGARSAVFAPLPDLRLIVVDEEHDASYKQESSPRYHARDVAVVRARLLGVPVVLGSATPSLESAHNCRTGKYQLVELQRRATSHDLPHVTVVPLDGAFYRSDGSGLVSAQLDHMIRSRLEKREQILIFLNRRGFATYLHCIRCGWVFKCDHCDVTMTFHRRSAIACCHLCGFTRPLPPSCPVCRMPGPRKGGAGTEKVVATLARLYPVARVARLDRDTVTSHHALKETLARFARGEQDILVGTQMVAKGHDFPGVSLVGILLADTGLHQPDFRAAERTYQLITQVSGRAGRGDRPGRVIVQTFFPEHYAVELAAKGDWRGFLEKELSLRKEFSYPPFARLAKVVVSGRDEERVRRRAVRIGERLRSGTLAGVQVLGPGRSPIARIHKRHRMQLLLKSGRAAALHDLLRACERDFRTPKGVDVQVDVDPQSLL